LQKKSGVVANRFLLDLPVFLRGVLEKVLCSAWFFCGEVVVNCVANVDRKLLVFGREK
jgi:hypothetical protein